MKKFIFLLALVLSAPAYADCAVDRPVDPKEPVTVHVCATVSEVFDPAKDAVPDGIIVVYEPVTTEGEK